MTEAANESANAPEPSNPALAVEPTPLPTLDESLPTLEESANASVGSRPEVLADIPEALAGDQIEVVDIANAEFDQNTRIEMRRNKHGKLRGLAWRERNKDRKVVWYVGAKSEGKKRAQWLELKPFFESANAANAGRNDTGASVGSDLDWPPSVGTARSTDYVQ